MDIARSVIERQKVDYANNSGQTNVFKPSEQKRSESLDKNNKWNAWAKKEDDELSLAQRIIGNSGTFLA